MRRYETDEQFHQYMLLHYGSPSLLFPYNFGAKDAVNFPVRTAQKLFKFCEKFDKILDIGCGTGRSAFELAKKFQKVIAFDISSKFIQAANQLKSSGELEFLVKEEGEITSKFLAKIDAEIDRNRVEFLQADACKMPENWNREFDAIHMANVVCRLPEPSVCLIRLKSLLNVFLQNKIPNLFYSLNKGLFLNQCLLQMFTKL